MKIVLSSEEFDRLVREKLDSEFSYKLDGDRKQNHVEVSFFKGIGKDRIRISLTYSEAEIYLMENEKQYPADDH